MSNKDIGDIYKSMRDGSNAHESPKSISDIYKQVVEEATVSMQFDDGSVDEFQVSDERAAELRDISRVSITRNQMLVKVDGRWSGARMDQKQLKDIYTTSREMQDYGRIDDKIKSLATKSTIFDEYSDIKGHDKVLGELRNFLFDSAEKTLIEKGVSNPSDSDIKREVAYILNKIHNGEFQKEFIDQLENAGGADKGVVEFNTFNIWKAATDGSHNVFFDVKNHPDIVDLRPASDNKATRGAAGPGEALLSFIYGGVKPKGVGDILLDSGDGDTIELKKQQGRIGKEIKSSSLKGLEQMFHAKSKLSKPTQEYFTAEWNKNNPEEQVEVGELAYFAVAGGEALPEDLYTLAEIKKNTQEPGINIWPKEKYKKIFNDIIKGITFADDPAVQGRVEAIKKTLVDTETIKPTGGLTTKEIPQTFLAGTFKMDKQPEVETMSIREFLDKLSGVSFGKVINRDTMDLEISVDNKHKGKKAKTERVSIGKMNLTLPEIGPNGENNAWEIISSMPGNPQNGQDYMAKIVNLIGAWQLKHYLTHIQPFKWLLVFDLSGAASAITHQKIIETPLIELVPLLDALKMYFGIRKDAGGFDISVRT